jgi:hypothetical protein
MSEVKTSGPNPTSGHGAFIPSEHIEPTTDSGAAVDGTLRRGRPNCGEVATSPNLWEPRVTVPDNLVPSFPHRQPKSVRPRRAWPVSCARGVALVCAVSAAKPLMLSACVTVRRNP